MKCAGAQCKLATSRDSVPSLDTLAVKESIVLAVGEDLIHDQTAERRQWIAQVNTFLSRFDQPHPIFTSLVLPSGGGHCCSNNQ